MKMLIAWAVKNWQAMNVLMIGVLPRGVADFGDQPDVRTRPQHRRGSRPGPGDILSRRQVFIATRTSMKKGLPRGYETSLLCKFFMCVGATTPIET